MMTSTKRLLGNRAESIIVLVFSMGFLDFCSTNYDEEDVKTTGKQRYQERETREAKLFELTRGVSKETEDNNLACENL